MRIPVTLTLLIPLLLLVVLPAGAQKADETLRKAMVELAGYRQDEIRETARLALSVSLLDNLLANPDYSPGIEYWKTRGQAYAKLAERWNAALLYQTGSSDGLPPAKNPALEAKSAFLHALEEQPSAGEYNQILLSLEEILVHLYNEALVNYEASDLASALEGFLSIGSVCNLLDKAGREINFQNGEMRNSSFFLASQCLVDMGDLASAIPLAYESYTHNYRTAGVYGLLIEGYCETDTAFCGQLFQEAIEWYPDLALTFHLSRINAALAAGRTDDQVIAWIEEGLSQDQENTGLLIALGSVCASRSIDASGTGQEVAASDFFTKASWAFDFALAADPSNPTANYGAGQLRYNRAVWSLNKSPGQEAKRIEAGTENGELLISSLPFFLACEKSNPNELDCLRALSEVYSLLGQEKLSREFAGRAALVASGGQLSAPYSR